MDILVWLVLGLIAGVIANAIDPRPSQGGILGAIVLGVLGAIVGGFLGSRLLGEGVTGLNFQSVIIAVLGSLLLLFLGRFFKKA